MVNRHASNVAATLRGLADKGLLEPVPGPPRPPKTRGHWPEHAYKLTRWGESALADPPGAEIDGPPPPAGVAPTRPTSLAAGIAPSAPAPTEVAPSISQGLQLVFAVATDHTLPELFHTLAGAEALAHACWGAIVDGEQQEYAVAFAGDGALDHALDLVAVLAAARIPVRRQAVAAVSTNDQLRDDLRRRSDMARQARIARDTREAS
jgi:hypothetical protein